jgi:arylsulfatase
MVSRTSLVIATALVAALVLGPAARARAAAPRPPNIVLIVADDLGYGDLGSYGSKTIRTPHLDRMAAEGTRFSSFYVAQAVCTASRAALLTGSYPNRVGLQGALNHTSTIGISPDERLLSELLAERGYATAAFGKWHLGLQPKFLPLRHGFGTFLGLPYSNDNGPLHPTIKGIPPLPLIEGEAVVARDPDQATFTRTFTDRAVRFIGQQARARRPFLLYVPHVMPHVPIFAGKRFAGRSPHGRYADVVEELDAGVGEVLAALRRHRIERDTLVVFMSDNGPFLSYGTHAGSAGPLREGKLTTFEGGVRVPAIAWWPGKVPARVVDAPVHAMDLLPTLCELAGAALPPLPIDGRNVAPLLLGQAGARSPHEALFFYAGDELQAVRSGKWKLHFAHEYLTVAGPPGLDGKPANYGQMNPRQITESGIRGIASRHGYEVARQPLALYDLEVDPGERVDVAAAHPEIVRRLQTLAEPVRAELGDALTGQKGAKVRPVGRL